MGLGRGGGNRPPSHGREFEGGAIFALPSWGEFERGGVSPLS